jgi:predicted nuclease of predicted toxin-antitoxin system
VGTLSSELAAVLGRSAPAPRVYVDANLPAGLVAFMRQHLGWDVFFVMEHPDLRRARDTEHYRLARQMYRTLVTLDRDYFDDRRFPPGESSGVIVVSAPDERLIARVLQRVDRCLLRAGGATTTRPDAARDAAAVAGDNGGAGLPLAGRKVHAHLDWPVPGEGVHP